jgi:hypothetical protein
MKLKKVKTIKEYLLQKLVLKSSMSLKEWVIFLRNVLAIKIETK